MNFKCPVITEGMTRLQCPPHPIFSKKTETLETLGTLETLETFGTLKTFRSLGTLETLWTLWTLGTLWKMWTLASGL